MSNQVLHLAKLAALPISDAEIEKYEKQLKTIFEYMDQIKQLDLTAVSETFRTTEEENVLRDDVVTASLSQTEALKNSSATLDGFFVVPAIMKDENAP
ncbi:MAG: Asp-tRNA(Asn)/Glu-tRNA(Gln) amidotransferase subunit GatC [bacterium]|nr:Asp-tRNA(Asn)/Glu-tRNA(Gln) amidotransferase subunit GatC [bacterium]